MSKIIKKKYYRIKFTLQSPMNIGYGEGEKTDRDILRNSVGMPYIPASSIAGVMSSKMADDGDKKKYFGEIDKNSGGRSESRVIFYDAIVSESNKSLYVSIRDSVALDEYKTAKDGAKFDMEVLEAGTELITYIEQSYYDESDKDYVESVLKRAVSSGLSFGGKCTRGFGEIKINSINSVCFNLENKDEVDKWLDFDIESGSHWQSAGIDISTGADKTLTLKLALQGGLSIRRYTTEVNEGDSTSPDMEQLKSHTANDNNYAPVIPGTTWAGAIRHRMEEMGADVDKVFGTAGKETKRSELSFSESEIKDSKDKVISRNAIDRFTGGTVSGALFTEKICMGGETELDIRWSGKERINENDASALAATLSDLHFGLLAIGGATSIGRGIFRITSINGKEMQDGLDGRHVYDMIFNEIKEAFR